MQRVDNNTVTNDFGYNIRSEVIDAIMDTNTYSYAFDPIRLRSATARHVGNREWTRINANTNIYAANLLNQYTNILEGEAVSEPQHDLDGNMTATGDGWWYVWNGENRMILASNAEHVVTYAYDHQGRIVWKEIQRRDGETQSWEVEQAATLVWDGYNIVSTTIQHSSFTNHHSYV